MTAIRGSKGKLGFYTPDERPPRMVVDDDYLFESWGDVISRWDRYDSWRSEPSFIGGRSELHIDTPTDRQDGRDAPLFEDEHDLNEIRGLCRFICNEIPSGVAVLRNLANYIIGTGWDVEVVADPDVNGVSDQLVSRARAVVDDFIDYNDWIGNKDKESFMRTIRDGEGLVKLTARRKGIRASFNEPVHLTEPHASKQELEEWLRPPTKSSWSFGVHTEWDDPESVYGYHFVYDGIGKDWEYVPHTDMVHMKTGVDSGVKRGISEYYATRRYFPLSDKVTINTGKGAALQAAIAYIREHPEGKTDEEIKAFLTGLASANYSYNTPFGSREFKQVDYPASTVIDAVGYKYKDPPMATQRNPIFIEVAKAVARMAGVRWNMPEWMTNGDASNNNFSSALVATSPFVKSAEVEQTKYGNYFYNLMWKVLHMAYRLGMFDDLVSSWAELEAAIDVLITPTQVATKDEAAETTNSATMYRNGIMSKRTWRNRAGLDHEEEEFNLEQEGGVAPELSLQGENAPDQNPAAPSPLTTSALPSKLPYSQKEGHGQDGQGGVLEQLDPAAQGALIGELSSILMEETRAERKRIRANSKGHSCGIGKGRGQAPAGFRKGNECAKRHKEGTGKKGKGRRKNTQTTARRVMAGRRSRKSGL